MNNRHYHLIVALLKTLFRPNGYWRHISSLGNISGDLGRHMYVAPV